MAQALNVIIANDHLHPDGGADVVALGSARSLAALGVNVTLFVADAPAPQDDAWAGSGVRVVSTGQSDLLRSANRAQAAIQGLWNVQAWSALRRLLREHDRAHTVVHVHSWTKSLSGSAVRAALDAGFPVVCTLHDYFSICPNGGLFDFQRQQICERPPMSMSCIATHCDARRYPHKLYRVVRQAVQRHAGRMPDGISDFIFVSRFSQALLAPSLPRGSHGHFVRNPIEVPWGEAAQPAQRRAFVVVARLAPHKGQALFLRACAMAGIDTAVCVGDGPDRAALERLFPAARFTGQLPPAGVHAQMRGARALVLPSLWYETQGLVVDEAAALGVPAIVPDRCAAADAVTDGETGLVFRSGDAASLAAALRRLNDDDALTAALGQAARQRFWRHPPSPAAHAAALVDVYQRMLARTHATAQPPTLAGSVCT